MSEIHIKASWACTMWGIITWKFKKCPWKEALCSLNCVFMAYESWRRNMMISTNQSTVSRWIWTNESAPLWWLERFCLTPGSQSDCQWWRDNNSLWSSLSSAWSRPWPSPQITVHTRTCRNVTSGLSLIKIRQDTVLWLVEIIVLLRQLCQVMATKATFYYHYGCCVFMT